MALRDEPIEYRFEQYNEKNSILSAYGTRVTGRDLYEAIFNDLDLKIPVIVDVDDHKGVLPMTLDEAIEQCENRSDMMIGGVTYFRNFIKKEFAQSIYTFIVDMDNVYSGPLKRALMHDWKREDGKSVPMPTYIVNSGTGLHLYFVLKKPLPHFKRQWEQIDQLYRQLAKVETTGRVYIEFSSQWFGQDFRMAGGRGKDGWENTVFRVGDLWDADDLAAALGLHWKTKDEDGKEVDFKFEYKGEHPYRAEKKKRAKTPIYRRTGYYLNERVYESSVERCRTETHEGHRYMSMCALSVLAWKCKIAYTKLRSDLESLIEPYNKGAMRPIRAKEIDSAIKMYNPKAMTTQRLTTENWLGWEFIGARRNGRTQQEHLERARLLQTIDYPDGSWRNKVPPPEPGPGRPQKAAIVKAWRDAHPDGKKEDCHRDTGMSRDTIRKWWD